MPLNPRNNWSLEAWPSLLVMEVSSGCLVFPALGLWFDCWESQAQPNYQQPGRVTLHFITLPLPPPPLTAGVRWSTSLSFNGGDILRTPQHDNDRQTRLPNPRGTECPGGERQIMPSPHSSPHNTGVETPQHSPGMTRMERTPGCPCS